MSNSDAYIPTPIHVFLLDENSGVNEPRGRNPQRLPHTSAY